MKAFKTLGPLVLFLVGGYFIFIKMPFLFLRKSMNDQKKKMEDENKGMVESKKYTVDDYRAFQKTMRLLNQTEDKAQKEKKTEQKSEEKKTHQQQTHEKKAYEKKTSEKKEQRPAATSPEEIFKFRPGETFTQSELKKRYFELLKQNHPDRVASMGPDFKKLAEKNTKDINQAFETLKKKAS